MLSALLSLLPRFGGRDGSRDVRSPGTPPPHTSATVDRFAREAMAAALDGMVIYDRELRLVTCNRTFRDMFRLPNDVLREGATLESIVRYMATRGIYGEGPLDDLVATRLKVLTQPTGGLRMHYSAFGRVLDMRSMRLDDGSLFFAFYDATAQAKSEEELEGEKQTLERRVRERTEQLEFLNLDLAQAKAEAEDANISKTRFLAAASHDLLQPLNAARLYTTALCERLRDENVPADTARLAGNVDASLEAVEDILGALLEITQLDAGATRVELETVELDRLFRQLAIDFAPTAEKRGLKLTFVPSVLAVRSDRRLLRRLLQNLVSNALKYTAEGGVVVGVRRLGDTTLRLDVVDTGPGIPASKRLLIFREFERLPMAAVETQGAGLGLSIVDRLSHVLGHEITLVSDVGKGSRFSVTVPRAVAGASDRLRTLPAAKHGSLGSLVVAAIDNEVAILRGMELMLRGWGCIVASGVDLPSVEAELAALGKPPDVAVADYHIGEGDGLGVIAALRRRYGPLPAVLITADRSACVRVLASDADVRVLMKPLKPAALRALLSQWRLLRVGAG